MISLSADDGRYPQLIESEDRCRAQGSSLSSSQSFNEEKRSSSPEESRYRTVLQCALLGEMIPVSLGCYCSGVFSDTIC